MNDNNIAALLEKKNWQIDNQKKKAFKVFTFNNFKDAFSWMTEMSVVAEKFNHHPEWKNVYNKVEVTLTTHDKDSLTGADSMLAVFMDKKFEKY